MRLSFHFISCPILPNLLIRAENSIERHAHVALVGNGYKECSAELARFRFVQTFSNPLEVWPVDVTVGAEDSVRPRVEAKMKNDDQRGEEELVLLFLNCPSSIMHR
jgi:hypothetical protein